MLKDRRPLLVAAIALVAVVQGATHGRRRREPRAALPPIAVVAQAPRGAHPRLITDGPALARLRAAAHAKTPAWQKLAAACDAQLVEPFTSGYEGFDWSDAVADLALCWRATGERRFADGAVRYFTALVDDREKLGDQKGGELVVRHDSGYGIRSFGVFVALGYDWLWDAPTMTPALRARAVERLRAWLRWYGEKGYQRDHAIANYFCGWLAAETFAGLAVAGEAPDGDRWFEHARDTLLAQKVLPEYGEHLRGGDWPEGWQYGELSAAEVALVAEAMRTAAGAPIAKQLPWLREVVTHHAHALVPDGSAVYDNGDWSAHPARPSSLALTAIALALDPVDPAGAAEARGLKRRLGPAAYGRERAWLDALAERPGTAERDPSAGAPLSVELAGTGLAFLRSDWSPGAVWASFQSGPTLADHQHNDQGHFELWRGGDALVVDGGNYGSASTMSHNTLLVQDGGRHLNYPPNQGVWGKDARITRFADGGREAIVAGDFADAYAPSCAEDGCLPRSVRAATRSMLLVRPGVLIIDDRVTVDEAGFGVTWAAHFAAAPSDAGATTTARAGASRVDVQTLWPLDGKRAVVKEPTSTGEGPYRADEPWGPMWRLEVASPTGATRRRFLHVLAAGAAADAPPTASRLDGQGLSGVLLEHRPEAGGGLNVLFADEESGGRGEILAASERVLLAGLRPGARYAVAASSLGAKCLLDVKLDPAGAVSADAGGVARLATPACPR